jgi:signal transduction histidine kinase
MKTGGTLTVSLEPSGEDWQINFADTGPGMSQQLIEKVFEPFQSQFEGGTGLGLAIVYQIVQAHEGKVWARSNLGHGSVFVLRLPRYTVEETLAAPQTGSEPQSHATLAENASVAAVGGGARG